MKYRRGALLYFKVIHQISRSHGTNKSQILTRIGRFRTDGFEMVHNAKRGKEELPYWSPRPSVEFQGHMGWKIDDLNPPIWIRLLGQSLLTNPSDLPCSNQNEKNIEKFLLLLLDSRWLDHNNFSYLP